MNVFFLKKVFKNLYNKKERNSSAFPTKETVQEHSKPKLKRVGKKAYQIPKTHQFKTKKMV